MRLVWTPNGWEDYLFWQKLDKKKLKRVNALLTEIIRDPKGGIGKPEPLQFGLSGCWSRRIDQEHRLVYLIDGDDVVILQARYHYSE